MDLKAAEVTTLESTITVFSTVFSLVTPPETAHGTGEVWSHQVDLWYVVAIAAAAWLATKTHAAIMDVSLACPTVEDWLSEFQI